MGLFSFFKSKKEKEAQIKIFNAEATIQAFFTEKERKARDHFDQCRQRFDNSLPFHDKSLCKLRTEENFLMEVRPALTLNGVSLKQVTMKARKVTTSNHKVCMRSR